MVRRDYKSNRIGCVKVYLEYLENGEDSAINLANELFGKSGNWALIKKLKLTNKGGWKKDWLTNLFRDLDEVFVKHGVK